MNGSSNPNNAVKLQAVCVALWHIGILAAA